MLTSFRRRGAEVFHFFITVLADPSAGFEVNELFGTEGQFFGGGGGAFGGYPLFIFQGDVCFYFPDSWFDVFPHLQCVGCVVQALCLFSDFLVEKNNNLPLLVLHQVPIYWGTGGLVLCRLRESTALLFTVNSRQWVFEKQPFFDFVVYLEAFFCWEKVKVGEPHQTSTKAFLHRMSSPSPQHFYCIIFFLTLRSHTFGIFFSTWEHISG